MELLIRYRSNNDPWTVAYTNTISVHLENQRFQIETDQHIIGTLDGSTRPYPAWSAVNWLVKPLVLTIVSVAMYGLCDSMCLCVLLCVYAVLVTNLLSVIISMRLD
ncbi:hypothetical protein Tco_0223579 [Tanacetum coccineum]